MVVLLGQLGDDHVLGKVGVLILIYKDIVEALLIFLQDVGVVAKQYIGIHQQVVKVHRIRYLATVAIGAVNLAGSWSIGSFVLFNKLGVALIVGRSEECVLHH